MVNTFIDDLSEHAEDIEIDTLIIHQPRSGRLRNVIESDIGYWNDTEDPYPPPNSPTYSKKFAEVLIKQIARNLTSKTFRDEMRING